MRASLRRFIKINVPRDGLYCYRELSRARAGQQLGVGLRIIVDFYHSVQEVTYNKYFVEIVASVKKIKLEIYCWGQML